MTARTFTLQPWLGILGFLVLATTAIGMHREAMFFSTHVYELVWWSTLLLLDFGVWWRRGRSPLFSSPLRLVVLGLWSVAFWLFFELVNLRIENWYYINVSPSFWTRSWGSFVCFATVLPATLLLADLFGGDGYSSGALSYRASQGASETDSQPSGTEKRVPSWVAHSFVAVGVVSFLLSLVWPTYFFPLIWGSLFFILEAFNYRRGAFSFLREFERKNNRHLGRFLLVGLVLGWWWELWNHSARVKWIYTVPFFEEWKLFEMPILGFLGFPPFALECAALVSTLEHLRLLPTANGVSRFRLRSLLSSGICAAGMAAVVFPGMDRFTHASTYPLLQEYTELEPAVRNDLYSQGVTDGFGLLKYLRTSGELQELEGLVELSLLRGVGIEKARALKQCGIRTVGDLAAQNLSEKDDEKLYSLLSSKLGDVRLSPAEVRVWIRGAKLQRGEFTTEEHSAGPARNPSIRQKKRQRRSQRERERVGDREGVGPFRGGWAADG